MKIFKTIFTLFFLQIFFGNTFAQNMWQKKASCGGSKRERAVGFSIGGKGYIGTGQDTSALMLKDLWEYDTLTNAWTQKADFAGVARRDAVGFAIGSKGYIGTGIDNASSQTGNLLFDFWEYDPSANLWTQKADYPGNAGGGIYYATGFETSGMGYVCCGKEASSNYSDELWQYNPGSDSWMQRASFPPGVRYGLTSFSVNGKGYVGTGADENLFNRDLWEYNPTNDSWIQKADVPGSARFSCTGFSIGTKGYIVLGTDGGMRNDLFEYNPTTNSWVVRAAYAGVARRSASAFVCGSKAYVGTGNSDLGTRKDMYVYTPWAPLGVEEITSENFVSVFPNPIVTSATVCVTNQKVHSPFQFFIYDLTGKKIFSMENIFSQQFQIERGKIPSGVYLYELSNEKKIIGTGKLIIE